MYNKKYLKTEIKSCHGKINTNFHDNGMSKEGSHCVCLSVRLIENSVFKMGKTIIRNNFWKNVNML